MWSPFREDSISSHNNELLLQSLKEVLHQVDCEKQMLKLERNLQHLLIQVEQTEMNDKADTNFLATLLAF